LDRLFSISELAREAGVSVRTIRFYINEGLIPPPEVRGRNTLYTEDYLDRIELILRLKEAFLPLREIRQKMQGLSADAVRDLLGKADQVRQSAASSSQRYRKINEAEEEGTPQKEINDEAESAAEYIARILESRNITPRSLNQPQPVPAPAGLRQNQNQLSLSHPAPSSTPAFQPQTTWQRIIIAPGIELHISQPILLEKRAEIQRLIDVAQQLFEAKRA